MNTSNKSSADTLYVLAADIKLAHSVFAMPFALLAAFMAARPLPETGEVLLWPDFLGRLALIVLAMFFARCVAMLANRLIDRDIDARNPRTSARALPSGRVSAQATTRTLGACAAAFMIVCMMFGVLYDNWWPPVLALPVLLWISAYGYFKRFTAWCHLYLGSSLAISPLAAALAIEPTALATQPALWLLSVMVLLWVAGFDVIYSLQDVEVDRKENLYSIPVRFGRSASLGFSRAMHAISAAALIGAWLIDERFGWVFGSAVILVAALLLTEHLTVSRWGTKKIALSFFTLNGIISCVLGIAGIIDTLDTHVP